MSIAIYGAGGLGREVLALLREIHPPHEIVAFVDDHPSIDHLRGLPVLTLANAVARFSPLAIALAIGSPAHRKGAAERALAAGCTLATVIHPSVPLDPSVTIGAGTVICRNSSPTVDVVMGVGVQINPHCTIGHDAILRDYATLYPGAHISGNVTLGECALVGAGAVVIQGTHDKPLTIGAYAVVGAGACVIRDVPERDVVVGVPAQSTRRH